MTDSNPNMIAYDALRRHEDAIEAFSSLLSLMPSNDALYPLLALLSANLEVTFRPLMPLILAKSVKQ